MISQVSLKSAPWVSDILRTLLIRPAPIAAADAERILGLLHAPYDLSYVTGGREHFIFFRPLTPGKTQRFETLQTVATEENIEELRACGKHAKASDLARQTPPAPPLPKPKRTFPYPLQILLAHIAAGDTDAVEQMLDKDPSLANVEYGRAAHRPIEVVDLIPATKRTKAERIRALLLERMHMNQGDTPRYQHAAKAAM